MAFSGLCLTQMIRKITENLEARLLGMVLERLKVPNRRAFLRFTKLTRS